MIRNLWRGLWLAVFLLGSGGHALAQQYAAMVLDARTGGVLHESNADTQLHPASLTKMMTLYIVFDAVRQGRLSLDQKIRISQNAAAEPPSKLGLKAGQQIEMRYLIRAAAIKSANDAATALGEAVAGSEVAFAELMTQYARAMGMKNTTFRNAHGLTAEGHLSSARDMATLGRRLFFDFPQYYNIFSRNSTSAGLMTVKNTNRRLLDAYPGADGIKTGYTRAAGFNLVSSAQRGNKRVIVSVFGGKSSATRNAEVARLMDLGFQKMPAQARLQPPAPLRTASEVAQSGQQRQARVEVERVVTRSTAGSTFGLVEANAPEADPDFPTDRVALSVARPMPRHGGPLAAVARSSESIAEAIAEVNAELAAAKASGRTPLLADGGAGRPAPRPGTGDPAIAAVQVVSAGSASTFVVAPPAPPRVEADMVVPQGLIAAATVEGVPDAPSGTTGGQDWGVQIGAFRSKGDAERQLLTTALKDVPELNGGMRRVEAAKLQGVTIFRAQFVGLTQDRAVGACTSLAQLQTDCTPLAPGI